MDTKVEKQTEYFYEGRRVSELGYRILPIRKMIEEAAARGELKLLNHEELERVLENLRPSDPDLP